MAELDPRFQEIEKEELAKEQAYESSYQQLLNERQALTDQQKTVIDKWGVSQEALAKQQQEFANMQTEQARQQLKTDYTKEQTGAYTDYAKQSSQYGATAEQQASQGMSGSGYSESSKTSMYTAYQNRVAAARDSFNRASLVYENNIKEAQLTYNTKLAEISYNQLQQQMNLALQDFEFRSNEWQNRINYLNTIDQMYYGRKQDVQQQINTEKQFAESVRQWEAEMAYKREQDALAQANFERQVKASSSGGGRYRTIKEEQPPVVGPNVNTSTAVRPLSDVKEVGTSKYYQDEKGVTYVRYKDNNNRDWAIKVGSVEYGQLLKGKLNLSM